VSEGKLARVGVPTPLAVGELTPELRRVVDRAYEVFGTYHLSTQLIACHCNACMHDETERQLLRTPMRSIPSSLLAEYTNSAHGWDDDQIARDMRYFLPRYLELLALHDPPDHLGGMDVCLRRLGEAEWRTKWPAVEVNVLDAFFDELLVSCIERLEADQWPAGWRLRFDLGDVLTLGITGGGDVSRMLRAWDGAADPPAAIHMAGMRRDLACDDRGHFFDSSFLESWSVQAHAVGEFLMRPEVGERIEATFFRVSDPVLQEILSAMR
jgi:hypothetical protein